MNWLKKFGSIVLKIGQIAAGVAPIIAATNPQYGGPANTVANDFALIASIIQQVEVMGQALGQAGPDKLKAASPLVAQIILQSSLLAKHQIADPARFKAGVDQVASGMAEILSSLEDKVETTSKIA